MKICYLLPLLIMIMSLVGCQPAKQYLGSPEQPYPPDRKPEIGDILHLATGFYVKQQAMLDQIIRTQVIFVGETHDNPASHHLQEKILQALEQHNPGKITLAMEMFTPSQQPVLNRWTKGELSEKEFLKQVDWYHNWRMNFAFYRPLLNYCRNHRIPILALNAENDLKQKVSSVPFVDLTEKDQQQLPEMDYHDPYQQAMVQAVFSEHKMGQTILDGFQRVQTLWDETMAANLANYLKKISKNRQVMIIAGSNHIRYGFGIPRRLFRRVPVSYLLIGSEELNIPQDKQDRLMDIVKPNYPMPPYNFVTFIAYEDLPNPGVKLGILLDKIAGGLIIKGVVPGSIAEKQGLQKNDLLIQIDNQPLHEPFDLIYELQQKSVGEQAKLILQREGKQVIKTIKFSKTE